MKFPTIQEFAEVADALQIDYPELIEKDYYAVVLLENLLDIDFPGYTTVFAGGTCLSKAHLDTNRMSEDIDIKLIPKSNTLKYSGGKQKKIKKDHAIRLKEKLIDNNVFEHYEEPEFNNEYRFQTYNIKYPRNYHQYSESIKPYLQLELTECKQYEVPVVSSVQSLFSRLRNQAPEIQKCSCASLNSIAAEKFISLLRRTAEFERGISESRDQFLVRHAYDLSLIYGNINDFDQLAAVIHNVINDDITKFGNRHVQFKDDYKLELQYGLDKLVNESRYKESYNDFLGPLVYGSVQVTWDKAIDDFKLLYDKVTVLL